MSVILDLLQRSGVNPTQAFMLLLFVPFLVPFFYFLYRAPRSSARPVLRQIPAYDALKKLLSRAAETGQQVHVSVGTASIAGPNTAETMAGLYTLEFLADRAANSDIPPLVTTTDPTTFPASSDQLRRAYERQGYPEEYRFDQTRFIAPPVNGSTVPYAAGVMDILNHEPIAANVMVGAFNEEFLLMAEPGAQRGLYQISGASNLTVLPFVQMTSRAPLLGEEIFAAGAYLLNRVGHYTSIVAQDIFRIMLVLFVLVVVILRALGIL